MSKLVQHQRNLCKEIFGVYAIPVTRPDAITPDVTALKAIAHPLRLRLLGELRLHGPSTATRLAAVVGESSGATSYHLRQLERHGFVEDAAGLGTGRERWWRAAAQFTSVGWPEAGEGRDAAGAFHQAVVSMYARTAQQAAEEQSTLPEPWAALTSASDAVVRVTAEQAEQIRRRFEQLIWQVVEEYPAATDEAPPGARLYQVQVQSFAMPGQGDD